MEFLNYLDKNNLYGFPTSKYFPVDRFKWLDPANLA